MDLGDHFAVKLYTYSVALRIGPGTLEQLALLLQLGSVVFYVDNVILHFLDFLLHEIQLPLLKQATCCSFDYTATTDN